MKRIAFYGGSFDPVHHGHLTIAKKLSGLFDLDEFWFVPAFRAPHKQDKQVTSALCRYGMLALATGDEPEIKISTVELNAPERPYTFETQAKLKKELPGAEIFFVMGADSWAEIDTWRRWETVLTETNIIVVTRPGYQIGFTHVTEKIRDRIIDLRSGGRLKSRSDKATKIFLTDSVQLDISATEIRRQIRENEPGWRALVPEAAAKYIEKYKLYI